MKIRSLEFTGGAVEASQLPDDLPEVAVAGRSNVGKSSFLNFLLERKSASGGARTSKKPGKTKEINFFKVNGLFYLVDIPGFGYVKGSHAEKRKVQSVIQNYFKHSRRLAGVFYLLDSRHGITATDREGLQWMDVRDVPRQFVATKADKLKKKALETSLRSIQSTLELPVEPLAVSALKKTGRAEVWAQIEGLLGLGSLE